MIERETHTEYAEPDSPEGVAIVDQAHAHAIERLRGAKVWALIVLEEPDEGVDAQAHVSVGGGGTIADIAMLARSTQDTAESIAAKVIEMARREAE